MDGWMDEVARLIFRIKHVQTSIDIVTDEVMSWNKVFLKRTSRQNT